MDLDKPLRMYILVKDTIPLGLAVNSVGHSTIACYRKFQDHPDMQEWIGSSHFKKVTCVVPDGQFQAAKKVEDHIVMTERSLDGAETCIAFRPRRDYPKHFSFFKLFGSDIVQKMKRSYTMNEKEHAALTKWIKEHKCSVVADESGLPSTPIGGAISIRFTPTSIGLGVDVECVCGAKEDVTDIDSW